MITMEAMKLGIDLDLTCIINIDMTINMVFGQQKKEFYQHYGSNCNWKRIVNEIMKKKLFGIRIVGQCTFPASTKRFIQTMLDTYE